jgi:hypothetical protein
MVKCSNTSYQSIQEYLVKRNVDELNNIVNKWNCFVINYIEKHGIKTAYERMQYLERYHLPSPPS